MAANNYLIISRNTGQMLLVDKILRDNRIAAEVVPAPPRPGLVCTRAIRISGTDLDAVQELFSLKKVQVSEIMAETEMKLQKLMEEKINQEVISF
jgi:biotin synthase